MSRLRMVKRTARVIELLSSAGKFGGGWEVQWMSIVCLPLSGELIRRDETETFKTAVDARQFVINHDADLAADSAFGRYYAGVVTSIEWDPCTRLGQMVVNAIT